MVIIALALTAAALSALSSAGEQRAASRLAAARGGASGHRSETSPAAWWHLLSPAGIRRRFGYVAGFAAALLSSPLWLGSWLTDAASFVTQSTALHLGALSTIQLLMVTTLLFSLPLAALSTGQPLRWPDWAGGLLVCGGLMLVLSTRELSQTATVNETALATAMGMVLILAIALVGVARGRRPHARSALLAGAAGALFSVGAAATKLAAATVTTEGFGGLLTSWAGYVLAVASLASFALQQAAFASGPLAPAMTAVVIVDPLVSYALGAVGYAEPLPSGGLLLLAVLGMTVVSAGVATLAHSPLLDPARKPAEAPSTPPTTPPTPAELLCIGTDQPAVAESG